MLSNKDYITLPLLCLLLNAFSMGEGVIFNGRLTTCNAACSSPICDTFSLPVLIIDLSVDAVPSGILAMPGTEISFAPNPFDNKLLVNFNCVKNEKLKLILYDMPGKPVFIGSATLYPPGRHTSVIDLDKLPAGVYSAAVETERTRNILKLMKISGTD